jgi:trimethylamine--corrinoid protein Co-methyltransferase
MGGSNYVHHAAGMLESMAAVAYEQYVIDDEIIGSCMKTLKGITVDAEHLALEVIDQVGPGGNFMTTEHTMQHLRSEYFQGNGVTDRKNREQWEEDGSQDARDRAREIVKTILSCKEKSYIPKEIDRLIREKFNILL